MIFETTFIPPRLVLTWGLMQGCFSVFYPSAALTEDFPSSQDPNRKIYCISGLYKVHNNLIFFPTTAPLFLILIFLKPKGQFPPLSPRLGSLTSVHVTVI